MPYWQDETPVVIETGANVLRWYRQADRLQVSRPDWTTDDGETRPGKTVTLRLDVLHETDTPEALAELLEVLLADVRAESVS